MLTPPPIEHQQTPPPIPVAVPETDRDALTEINRDVENLETDGERKLRQFSGFLFSLIVHLVILIVLALVLIPTDRSAPLVISIAAADTQDPWTNTEEFTSMTSVDIAETLPDDPASSEIIPIDLFELVDLEPNPMPGASAATTDAPSDGPSDSGPTSKPKTSIKFFGAEAYGNRFVFVLDVSSSMSARNGGRLARATQELIGSINQLNDEQDFSVILYSNHALPMFVKNNEAVMRQATPTNKQAAITWLRYRVRPNGGTMPARALQIAGNLKPDAVFFLSDGEFLYGHGTNLNSPLNYFFQGFGSARKAMPPPRDGVLDPKAILAEYPREIVVHTIAFESVSSGPLMKMIATQKGGQYRFIPAP